jgi:murein tripeptide amidase MpaA
MKGICILFLFATFGILSAASGKIRYDGYKVYRINPRTSEDAQTIKDLQQLGFEFWHGPSEAGKPSDVMIAPHQQAVLQDLKNAGLDVAEYIQDVQKLIDNEGVSTDDNNLMVLNFTQYGTLDQITSFIQAGARDHSDIASVISIGKSFEGRDLNVIKISKSNDTKPIVFIDANIHAREWITSAVATYVIDSLLNEKNTNLTSYLNDFDIYILPVLNPDGFAYTHETNRLWRKTRSNISSTSCLGADPNRNFGFHWLEGGSSTNPCSETHAGARAFSEVESLALSQFLSSIQSRLVFYLSVHSYGHYILIPYGHTNVKIPEYDEYYRIGSAAARSIAQRYNTQFRTGNVVDLLYVASGESFDWVRGVLNPYLALGIELRDQGRYGFVLPADQIIPSGEEFVDGLVTFLAEVKAGTQNKTSSPVSRPARILAEVKVNPDFASFGHYRHPSKPLSPLSSFQRD